MTDSLPAGGGGPAEPVNSIVPLLGALKDGDRQAANEVTRRYFARVVRAADRRLASRPLRGSGPEDIAASVFESLWQRAERGGFAAPDLADPDDLWRLLCHLLERKVNDHRRREWAKKRGGGGVRGESIFAGTVGTERAGIGGIADSEFGPDELAAFAERHDRLMTALGDETLREIATLRLEGHELSEIGSKLSVSDRTIKRKLAIIREIWRVELGEDAPAVG